jgi:hypothetical protein
MHLIFCSEFTKKYCIVEQIDFLWKYRSTCALLSPIPLPFMH